ncbi:MAG: DUF4199 domain-containing protein [Bacteroidaceae bacterium]|nr:DUF4199 domain-containing protein [Bacteroidaceae bacterium]
MGTNYTPQYIPYPPQQICRRLGLIAAAQWSASFLCSMYGRNSFWLSQLGLFIGLWSVYYIGKFIRIYRQRCCPTLSFSRAYWLCLCTFLYASLLTTFVQYLYFRFLDGGQFYNSLQQMLEIPEYANMLAEMSPGAKTEDLLLPFSSPVLITQTLFLYNMLLSFLLAIVSAIVAKTGGLPDNQNDNYHKE